MLYRSKKQTQLFEMNHGNVRTWSVPPGVVVSTFDTLIPTYNDDGIRQVWTDSGFVVPPNQVDEHDHPLPGFANGFVWNDWDELG